MITVNKADPIYYGLSSDTKPEAFNGCPFIEIDTGNRYLYDAENAEWLLQNGSVNNDLPEPDQPPIIA